MHEVLHVSTGPRANWLSARYFDAQSEYFVYSDEDVKNSHVDPQVHFVAGKQFTPRALFWEFRTGFGRLERIAAVYESKDVPDDVVKIAASQVPSSNLYWTDNLKIPLHPRAQNEIPNWEYDPIKYPQGRLRGSESRAEFVEFDQGLSEYQELNRDGDYLDTTLRHELENCDSPAGMNVVTDFSGWGGFSSGILEGFRDEFSSKLPVFTWAACSSPRPIISNLETYLGFSEFSSLLLPLDVIQAPEDTEHLELFETVALLSSLRKDRVSMYRLMEDLTLGSSCNIISATPWRNLISQRSLLKAEVKISRPGSSTSNNLLPSEDGEHLQEYYCPQPLHGSDKTFKLQLTDNPLALRKLVPQKNHDLRERIYELTEPYIWSYQSDSDDDD